jgi:hypothetical protein
VKFFTNTKVAAYRHSSLVAALFELIRHFFCKEKIALLPHKKLDPGPKPNVQK